MKTEPRHVKPRNRPDLSERSISAAIAGVDRPDGHAGAGLARAAGAGFAAGPVSCALGAVLLLAPLLFLVMKRSGRAQSPPAWFIVHVLATSLGSCLIFVHAAQRRLADSPPGIVLMLMTFLILQGSLLRVVLSRGFSLLFARSSAPQGFSAPPGLDKQVLQGVIDAKVRCCKTRPGR